MYLSKAVITSTLLLILSTFFCTAKANAEPGVSDSTIKIGLSTSLTGMNATSGNEIKSVISAYFSQLNTTGGINGRTLTLVTMDDAYLAERAAANTNALIERNNVFALTCFNGTSATIAALPVLTAARTPLIGTISGAESMRTPNNHYLFHTRASYSDETKAIIKQLLALGLTNIGIFYQNDGFGKAGLNDLTLGLRQHNIRASMIAGINANTINVNPAVAAFKKVKPQAIVMVTLEKVTSAFVRRLKSADMHPYLATYSSIGAIILNKELGDLSRGIMVSEVMPYLWDDTLPITHDFKKIRMKEALTYTGLEAYVNARVLAEAIRLTGKNLTRERLIDALEHMHNYSIGGYTINFSPTNHNGSQFVDITILGQNGQVLR